MKEVSQAYLDRYIELFEKEKELNQRQHDLWVKYTALSADPSFSSNDISLVHDEYFLALDKYIEAVRARGLCASSILDEILELF